MNYASAYMATLWAGIMGVIIMLPFDAPHLSFTHVDTPFWLSLLYTAMAGTVVAMVFWNIGVQQIGGTKSGIFLNFNPIFTAVLAYLLMGERVHTAQVVGTALVITGVSLFSMPSRSKRTVRQDS